MNFSLKIHKFCGAYQGLTKERKVKKEIKVIVIESKAGMEGGQWSGKKRYPRKN